MLYPWLEQYYGRFVTSCQSGRVPNSLIIAGHEGIGVNLLALEIAKYFLCHHPTKDGACGKCVSCTNLARLNHPDLKVAYSSLTEEKDRDQDFDFDLSGLFYREPARTRREVRIDTMRKVPEFINESAIIGSRKVVIIESAETMSVGAANAILKTFEEPRENTMMIMVAKSLEVLLPTILSRASKMVINEIPSEESIAFLISEKNQHPRRADYLKVLAEVEAGSGESKMAQAAQDALDPVNIRESCPGLCELITRERAEVALALSSYAPLKAMDTLLAGDDLKALEIVREISNYLGAPELASPQGVSLIRQFGSIPKPLLISVLKELMLEIAKYKARIPLEDLPLIKHARAENLQRLRIDQIFEASRRLRFVEDTAGFLPARAPNAVNRSWMYALTKQMSR